MPKKGFTLLELLTVVVVVGILGSLGLSQYSRTMEKSRGAEARAIIGDIRKLGAVYYQEHDTLALINQVTNLNIGTAENQFPSAARNSHYFTYAAVISNPGTDTRLLISAIRCSGDDACRGGRTNIVASGVAGHIRDEMDYSSGQDNLQIPAFYQ